jgi:deoxyribonuclease-4
MEVLLGPAGVPTSTKGTSTEAGIQEVKRLGLNCMEIEFVRQVYMDNRMARQAGQLAKSLGVELSVHAPYFINLCNPEKLKASMKRILDSCERAHHMGARVVVFHPGFYGKLEKEEACGMVRDACRKMAARIRQSGWNVKLGPETMGKQGSFGTVDELVRISREVDGVMPVLDFAHIYARQGGKIDFGKVFDALKPLKLKRCHAHVTCVHHSLVGPGRGNERYHLTLDEKKPDYLPLVEEVMKRKLDITLISESPVLEQDALRLKRMFERKGHKF